MSGTDHRAGAAVGLPAAGHRRQRRARSSAFLVAAAVLGYGYAKFGQIPRVEIADFLSDSSEIADGVVAENFLLVGVDSADGLDPDDPVRSTRAADRRAPVRHR